jgi:hypothetical protein
METFLKDKKISVSVFILIVVVSLLTVSKLVSEVKTVTNGDYANMITVSGTGEVSAVSDIASLSVNLSKEGKTAKEAQDLLNESITKTLTYLEEKLIEEKDIKSEYGGLSPKYSYEQPVCYTYPCPSRDPKIVGYTATQSITIKVRVVDLASEIRTGLAEIGITDISGPTFSIDDEDIFKAEAQAEAIKDAKAKAKVLAKELGVRLGKVVSYYDNEQNCGMGCGGMYDSKMMLANESVSAGSVPPTLPKGENKITSSVSVTFEIH